MLDHKDKILHKKIAVARTALARAASAMAARKEAIWKTRAYFFGMVSIGLQTILADMETPLKKGGADGNKKNSRQAATPSK